MQNIYVPILFAASGQGMPEEEEQERLAGEAAEAERKLKEEEEAREGTAHEDAEKKKQH